MDTNWLSLLSSCQWSINFRTAFPFLIGQNKLKFLLLVDYAWLHVLAPSLSASHELLDYFPLPYWSEQIRDSCYWWTLPGCPCSVPPSDPWTSGLLLVPRFFPPAELLKKAMNSKFSGYFTFKRHSSRNGLEIRLQSAFTAFRALLSSVGYSARWFGRVWQPSADCNSRLVHLFEFEGLPHPAQQVQK